MNLSELVSQGQANPLVLAAMAIALGALHGLEPGHSKTMIAAYVIAIRGTLGQAVLLGVSAALSHVVIVWTLAILGLLYGDELIGERMEPWFIMASGAIIVLLSVWIFRRSWTARGSGRDGRHRHLHADAHDRNAGHHHHDDGDHDHVHRHHGHADGPMDAHALAHARKIEARVASDQASTCQTILFGLTGGLIPCPAAITVLLLCLNLGQLELGLTLVAAFSIGLALTLVAVGMLAAAGMRYAVLRTSRLDALLTCLPYASAVLIGLVGLLMIHVGWTHLQHWL